MKLSTKLGLAVVVSALWLCNATAQKKDAAPAVPMPKAPADVTVDGQISEWKDTSFVFNPEAKLKYVISSDANYIYLVANLDQRALRQKVLSAGITLSINTEGKKKKTYSITYPVPADDNLNYVEKQHARLTKAKTDGFKGVDDITFPDDHGFKGMYVFNPEGNMSYELAIPIKMLNIKPGSPGLNINVCVNALDKPTSGGGDAPAGGGGGGGGRSRGGNDHKVSTGGAGKGGEQHDDTPVDMYTTTDFWLSYTLPGK